MVCFLYSHDVCWFSMKNLCYVALVMWQIDVFWN